MEPDPTNGEDAQASNGETKSEPIPRAVQTPLARAVGPLVVALCGLLFVIQGWSTLSAPFGDSHDGRNAATFALGSRSLREHGPVVSRLGAVNPESGVYADHPPLIYLETAAAETLRGSSRAATRAPAWLGSLAALWLLWVLLREQSFSQGLAALGVVSAATTPMFLVYGGMLETAIVALPFGLGLLICWFRAMAGRRIHPWLLASTVVLATFASWQGVLLAAIVAGWGAVGLLRKRGAKSLRIAAIAGFSIGMIAVVSWVFWAHGGSFKTIADQFLLRTGQSGAVPSASEQIRQQWQIHSDLYGWVAIVLSLLGLAAGLRAGGARRHLAMVALAVTVPYVVAFPGASGHDYWNYWFLLPLAIGITMAAEAAASAIARRAPGFVAATGRATPAVVLVGLAVLYRLLNVFTFLQDPPPAQQAIDKGIVATKVLGRGFPPGQETAWYAGFIGQPASWLSYATRRPIQRINGPQALAQVPAEDAVVVARIVCSGGGQTMQYSIESATQLRRNQRFVLCPAR